MPMQRAPSGGGERDDTSSSRSSDNKGREIEEFLLENDLFVCNNSTSLPTFQRGNCRSWIDVTFVSRPGLAKINGWEVLEDCFEDHRPIVFSISDSPQSTYSCTRFNSKYRKQKKLLELKNCFDHLIPNFMDCKTKSELDVLYDKFEETLLSLCNAVYKKKKYCQGQTSSWWNQELTAKRSQVRAARRRAQRAKDDFKIAFRCKYKQLAAEYRLLLKSTRRKS